MLGGTDKHPLQRFGDVSTTVRCMTTTTDARADEVLYDLTGHVATITLNAPERMNTISGAMLDELSARLLEADADSALVSARRFVAAYPEELIGFALLADAHIARRESSQARRALTDALAMLEKLDWFDETQRAQQRAYYRVALAGIVP